MIQLCLDYFIIAVNSLFQKGVGTLKSLKESLKTKTSHSMEKLEKK